MQANWHLTPAGGPLDSFVKVLPIEELFSKKVQASQREILLTVLTDMCVRDEKHLENIVFQAQLDSIQQQIGVLEKELVEKKSASPACGAEEQSSLEDDDVESMRLSAGFTEPPPLNEEQQQNLGCWEKYVLPIFARQRGDSFNRAAPLLPNVESERGRPRRLDSCNIM